MYTITKYNKMIFSLLVHELKLGTIDQTEADTEWKLKPYMNTSLKRKHIGDGEDA